MTRHQVATSLFVIVVVAIALLTSRAAAQTAPSDILTRATMAQAEKQLQDPTDDNARFALGIAQFLRAVERLGGTMNKFGLRQDELTQELPFGRLPVPKNSNPQ